ncbi:prostatic steroid-binding protein C2 [Rattus norvegicus]|uniref:Prostatic steroid-binding protein C2 n=3 Tax=Rattus norvegicus TaxID=10116 RepID=PSC2_RAT|nr:prostatic steroid-binding protein C2 precursor [Rattus norvegicus]P02781.1 RecName: Full=Prostatic steroid-binding protein C2; AltName: Full=Prostatein peptide C2; Flags: Precursor [Rattus norvegicus]EDM12776.1 prostatic steroid-binding protein C2 [Rattus norvegicus]CAA28708.1 PBP [Rattus norvegicus]|eukprot:NP_997476.2 prostatic steroid-binding protein C2 precursor [Rattus norvegicus]
MRLSLCLLTILVVCCYEANGQTLAGQVCQALQDVTITFLLNPEEELKRELEEFDAPPEAVEANLKVKRCINKIMYGDRLSMGTSLVFIMLKCDVKVWLQINFPRGRWFSEIN